MRERSQLTGTLGYGALECLLDLLEGRDGEARKELDALLSEYERSDAYPFVNGLLALAQAAAAPGTISRQEREHLVGRMAKMREHAPIPALMIAAALDQVNALPRPMRAWRDRETMSGIRDFATVISLPPAWVRRMDGLVRAAGGDGAQNRSAGGRRTACLAGRPGEPFG